MHPGKKPLTLCSENLVKLRDGGGDEGGQTLRKCVKLRNGCCHQGGQTLTFLNLRNGCDDHGKGTMRNDTKLRNGCGDPEAKNQ